MCDEITLLETTSESFTIKSTDEMDTSKSSNSKTPVKVTLYEEVLLIPSSDS